MNPRILSASILLPIFLLGCGANLTDAPGIAETTLTGFIARGPVAGDFTFHGGHEVFIKNKPLLRDIPAFDRIKTRHILTFDVVQKDGAEFKAILGPVPGAQDYAEAEIQNSAARVYIVYGWVYLTGHMPAAKTRWVEAAACGCSIAVQIREHLSPAVHRFVFLEGSDATVTTAKGTTPLPTAMTFVDVESDGTTSPPADVSTDPDAQALTDALEKMRAAAGF